MRLFFIFSLVAICAFSHIQAIPQKLEAYLKSTEPLKHEELIKLVSGNSIIGSTDHSHSIYELYFDPSGPLYFRKNRSNKEVYVGKWWVKEGDIYSHWPTYKKTTNQLRFYPIDDNAYFLYNVNNSSGPKDTFGEPFLVFPGDSFHLKDSVK